MARTLLFVCLAMAAATAGGCYRSSPSKGDASADGGGSTGIDANGKTPLGMACTPGVDPDNPLLTDFSAATYNAAKGKWGVDGNLTGTLYNFKDSGSTVSTKVESEALAIAGQVVPNSTQDAYAGGGLQFDACVNTSLYAGVQFTLAGTATGCEIVFELATYAEQPTFAKGGCSSYCNKFPQKKVTPRAGATMVLFSDLEDTGKPATAAAMATQILGVRWNAHAADAVDAGQSPCTFSLTVSDVQFIK